MSDTARAIICHLHLTRVAAVVKTHTESHTHTHTHTGGRQCADELCEPPNETKMTTNATEIGR